MLIKMCKMIVVIFVSTLIINNLVFVDCTFVRNITKLHTNSTMYEVQGKLDTIYMFTLSPTTHSCTMMFDYSVNKSEVIRVIASSPDATLAYPLLFGIREQLGIISWQIPLDFHFSHQYNTIGRTLCPIWNYGRNYSQNQNLALYVSTDSIIPLQVTLVLTRWEIFFINVAEEYKFVTSPSQPVYFEAAIPDDMNYVQLTLVSGNDYCALVSIQPIDCPVYDLEKNIQFSSSYLTMTRKGAFNIKASDYRDRRFYVVVVVKSNDFECNGLTQNDNNSTGEDYRKKSFTLKMNKVISKSELTVGIFVVPTSVLVISILICVIHFKSNGYYWQNLSKHHQYKLSIIQRISDQQTIQVTTDIQCHARESEVTTTEEQDRSQQQISIVNGTEINARHDQDITVSDGANAMDYNDEVDNVRVFVSQLGENRSDMVNFKNKGYFYITLAVVILYAMPVSKLVYNYEILKQTSGNLDFCYYNTLCMYTYKNVSDLNHVLSNILYVMLGITFIVIIWIRHHQCISTIGKRGHIAILEPWIFCGMGIALIGEGIMSSCYHICPNKSNFLFDTSFMYLIAALCMVKTYHSRRPNMNISAYSFFLLYATLLVFGLLGEIWNSILFWILYFFIHVFACFYLIARIYVKRQWKLDHKIFYHIYETVKSDWRHKRTRITVRRDVAVNSPQQRAGFTVEPENESLCKTNDPNFVITRMFLLFLIFILNISLALHGVINQPPGFATHLLAIFIGNLILYITYYIIMKTRSGEFLCPPRDIFRRFTFYYAILALMCWIPAVYYFSYRPVTQWKKTPAESRALNEPCIFMKFYDVHDVWHFLSAGGLFFSFLMLLTMDDDIIHIPQEKIMVF